MAARECSHFFMVEIKVEAVDPAILDSGPKVMGCRHPLQPNAADEVILQPGPPHNASLQILLRAFH
jgi:hypothetical protein